MARKTNQALKAVSESLQWDGGSFRDPSNRVFRRGERIFRALREDAHLDWLHLRDSAFFKDFSSRGWLVPTQEQNSVLFSEPHLIKEFSTVLEHENLPVISYPYEWTFGMLKDTALMILEMSEFALVDGLTLKDATPYNVQWRGAQPVFIDIPSFQTWVPGTPWAAYQQMCELFLYPLMLQAYCGIPFQPWLRGRLDGIRAEEISELLGIFDFLRPGVFVHVYLQSKLRALCQSSAETVQEKLVEARFEKHLILKNIKRLQKTIRHMHCAPQSSLWIKYETDNTYSKKDADQKEQFVKEVLARRNWSMVWDLGCNRGRISRLAAKFSSAVLAIDSDHACMESLYQELKAERCTNIYPLLMDIADQSPGLGWKLGERKAMTERTTPDLVIGLAVVHHLVISRHIPLPELMRWFRELNACVIIEFVGCEDPMVKKLLQQKHLSHTYNQELFEECGRKYFRIVRKQDINDGKRTLYFLEPK